MSWRLLGDTDIVKQHIYNLLSWTTTYFPFSRNTVWSTILLSNVFMSLREREFNREQQHSTKSKSRRKRKGKRKGTYERGREQERKKEKDKETDKNIAKAQWWKLDNAKRLLCICSLFKHMLTLIQQRHVAAEDIFGKQEFFGGFFHARNFLDR